jgi:predicted DsbA family dithiol-disulfide isomerase
MDRKILIGILTVGAVAGGHSLGGCKGSSGGTDEFTCPTPGAEVAGDDVGRRCVPFEGKPKGAPEALVTIVEFLDFQCPFCKRVVPTIERLVKEYPDKVRVFFRHNPLPVHGDAPLASQAAVAADKQGKFWPMHDILFKNQANLERANLEKYAAEIGLDVPKFKRDIDAPETKKKVDDDLELVGKVGVQGAPSLFVNGRPLRGAMPYEQFKSVVDDELLRADSLMKKGVGSRKVFAALMKGEGKGLGAAQPPAPPDWGHDYGEATVAFVGDWKMSKGSVYREEVRVTGGKLEPVCQGISVQSLSVAGKPIVLETPTLTEDCKIVTKDYGSFQVKISTLDRSSRILVTSQQNLALSRL